MAAVERSANAPETVALWQCYLFPTVDFEV